MTTMTITDPTDLVGFVAFDRDGEELGEVEGVYMGSDAPEWAAVVVDTQFVIVPLANAELYEDSLDLPFTGAEVRSAPWQQAELLADLTEEQEDELVTYYAGEGESDGDDDGGPATVGQAGSEVAGAAKEQGQEVASAAVEHTQQVASTAKEEGRRVASTVKQQGGEVLRSTADQAGEVVETARQQASEVAQQASAEARNLLEETRTRIEDQTAESAHKLAENRSRLGAAARALAEGRPHEAPTVQGYVRRTGETLLDAADRAYGVSDDVRNRGMGGLLADVQTFARRRPGMFLLGTAVVGVLAGRAVRNAQGDDEGADEVAALRPTNGSRSAGRAGARGGR